MKEEVRFGKKNAHQEMLLGCGLDYLSKATETLIFFLWTMSFILNWNKNCEMFSYLFFFGHLPSTLVRQEFYKSFLTFSVLIFL